MFPISIKIITCIVPMFRIALVEAEGIYLCNHLMHVFMQCTLLGGETGKLLLCTLTGIIGREFQFLVPISGTPIGSKILIPFLIPKILVGIFFSNSAVEKLRNWNSDSKIWNYEKINVGIQYTSSCM
jgi:hypothetical protein